MPRNRKITYFVMLQIVCSYLVAIAMVIGQIWVFGVFVFYLIPWALMRKCIMANQ